ncbi:hypothetical protein BH10PSE19_BH10PSE19_14070 [soil metagenome]
MNKLIKLVTSMVLLGISGSSFATIHNTITINIEGAPIEEGYADVRFYVAHVGEVQKIIIPIKSKKGQLAPTTVSLPGPGPSGIFFSISFLSTHSGLLYTACLPTDSERRFALQYNDPMLPGSSFSNRTPPPPC